MGFFDGTRDLPAGVGGFPRFKPGKYPEITVRKTHVVQGHNGTRFVLEGEVTAEPVASGETDKNGRPILPTPLGSVGSWTADITGQYAHLYGKPEAKACVGAVCGHDIDGTNARGPEIETIQNLCVEAPHAMLAGRKVATEAFTKATKAQEIVKHLWFPVAGQGPFVLGAPIPVAVPPPSAVTAPPPVKTALERVLAAGFVQHPSSPAHYYKGKDCNTPDALVAAGLA